MAVRRLAPDEVQPASFAFTPQNTAWMEEFITHYPAGKQASAVIPLLMRAQDQDGWVTKACIELVANKLGMAQLRVLEVATFYTQFQLGPVGTVAHVQVCGTTPCMLRGSDEIISICKSRIHHDPHHLSSDGKFSWEEVECLGACVNAPMVAVFKDTYEDLTPDTFNALLDSFARGEVPKAGPQNGRHGSVAEGGPTTLLDPGVYNGAYLVNIARDGEPAKEEPASAAPAAVAVPAPAVPASTPVAPPATPAAAAATPAKAVEIIAETAKPAPAGAAAVPAEEPTVSDEHKPELLTAARDSGADDLKLIWGVGPKLEELLHTLGVYHFDQIAGWNEMNLKWVDQNLGTFKGRAVRDKWIEQAAKLASGWRPSDKDGDKPA